MSQAPTTDADDVDGWCARHVPRHMVEASARTMAQLLPMVCETVDRSSARHVPRLVETSGRTKACLEPVVCEPSAREGQPTRGGGGTEEGGGSGCTSWALACAGAVFFRPWSQSPEHRRRTLTGGRSGLPTIGGGTGGGAECHAMPWMLQSRASWCPVQPLDFFISHHPLKS